MAIHLNTVQSESEQLIKSTGSRVAFADGLRGLAAFWVVLYHMSEGKHLENVKAYIPHEIYSLIFDAGHLGVGVFFVLSGFVMAFTVRHAIVDRHYALRFLLRRLIRLTPPYYFAILVTLAFAFIKGKALGLPYSFPSWNQLLAHAFYAQDFFSIPHFNIVYWTLCVEVQFYIAFALIFYLADKSEMAGGSINRRLWLIGTMALIALSWPLGAISTVFWPGGFLGFWFSFLAGILVCWGTTNGPGPRNFAIVFCAVLLMAGWWRESAFTLIVGLTGLSITCAGAFGVMDAWLNWRWLQWLALISYSLYLLHNPITGVSFRIAKLLFPHGVSGDIVGVSFALACCLIGSHLAYLLVEKPCIRWSQGIALRKLPT